MKETWKSNGNYKISNLGLIKDKDDNILKPRPNSCGYLRVTIDGHREFVHRLVAKLFIPNPDNLPVVNHKDGDKTNNCVDNLEWVTQSENVRKAYETGRAKPTENQRQAIIKTNHLKRKKVRQYDKEGNLIREFKSVREASEELNITSSMVSLIANGKRKSNKYFLKY